LVVFFTPGALFFADFFGFLLGISIPRLSLWQHGSVSIQDEYTHSQFCIHPGRRVIL